MTNELAPQTANPTEVTPVARRAAPVTWYSPAVDVLEGADGLQLVVDLPGVPPDKIEIRTEGRTLTVQGVRADRRVGWHRRFTLPATTDTANVSARSENGVLFLTLPTAEAAKPRKIEVR
jgi:HSP20 family protein